MMSSLNASLSPSARLCSQPFGPHPVRPRTLLHPGHDLALPDDHEEREHHAEREQPHDLDQDQPERVVGQQLLGGGQALPGRAPAPGPASESWARFMPTPPRVAVPGAERARAPASPGSSPGSHTTPSGRSAITTGSVIVPRSVRTVAGAPAVRPRRWAVAGLHRSCAGPGRAGQRGLVDGERRLVEQLPPRRQHRLPEELRPQRLGRRDRRAGAARRRRTGRAAPARRPRPPGSG